VKGLFVIVNYCRVRIEEFKKQIKSRAMMIVAAV